MARSSRRDGTVDPIERLALKPRCDPPPEGLSREQQFALHEFLHDVLRAAYRLYQIVPAEVAKNIICKKLREICEDS
jgi:hypothetical protein